MLLRSPAQSARPVPLHPQKPYPATAPSSPLGYLRGRRRVTPAILGALLRRFARLPRRFMAVAGAVLVGTLGAVAFAGPASASALDLSHELACGEEKGTATVNWTVKNNADKDLTIKEVARAVGDLKA